MKKAVMIILVVAMLLNLLSLFSFAKPIVPVTEQPQPEETAQPVGATIPKAVLIGIAAGAALIGGVGGYYYSRKRK